MKIALDIGNTFCKMGFFEQERLVRVAERLSLAEVRSLLETEQPEALAIVDVTDRAKELVQNLSFSPKILFFRHDTPLPITNLYATPHTLGMDRLAAVLGAYSLDSTQSHLVIDAGTCITYDFISQKGEYQGGSISLGLQMRFKALNHFTQKLPLVPFVAEKPELIGKSTQTAILSGVLNGLLHEIEGTIEAYETQFGQFQTWFCGGDAHFLAQNLRKPSLVRPSLLLEGLFALMKF